MARKKLQVRMRSYGVYTPFDPGSKQIPRVLEITTDIPARVGVEFGYVLQIRHGRGEKLTFRIDHPPFLNDRSEVTPPFEGEVYVRSSEWEFFLGDTVWAPADDKVGPWTLTTFWQGDVIGQKALDLIPEAAAAARGAG